MNTTFDISKIDTERQGAPASYGQIKAISYKFSKLKSGKSNYRLQKQIQGCLYGFAKEGKFSFKEAHTMLSEKKSLPKKYSDAIALYLSENLEA